MWLATPPSPRAEPWLVATPILIASGRGYLPTRICSRALLPRRLEQAGRQHPVTVVGQRHITDLPSTELSGIGNKKGVWIPNPDALNQNRSRKLG